MSKAGRKQEANSSPETVETIAAEIKSQLGGLWLAEIYRNRIRQLRTRSFGLPTVRRGEPVEVLHTLLGIELKVGKNRVLCPDLASARYLAVWARVGCAAIAVPYDITKISTLADDLESAWYRMLLLVEHVASKRTESFRRRVRRKLTDDLQTEITLAGSGPEVPTFNQNTRQRIKHVQSSV